jgi:hypothetical protein
MRGLNEIVPIPDIFCSGLGAIERIGGDCFRFYLYVAQMSDDANAQEKILVAKIILPASAVPDAVLKTIAAIGDGASEIIPMVAELVN